MRRFGVLVSTLALAVGGSSSASSSDRSPVVTRPVVPTSVLGVSWQRRGWLVRFDAVSLRVLPGRRVPMQASPIGWSFSPDRSRVALGFDGSLVRVVDARRMRTLGSVQVRPLFGEEVSALAWLRPKRLVGLDQIGPFVIDPVARRVLRRGSLLWSPIRLAVARSALVMLLSHPTSLEPVRLAVVNAAGRLRSIPLSAILAGPKYSDDEYSLLERREPGLAVDVEGNRAFVLGAGTPVAEVDLRTLAVEYHELKQATSLLRRVWNWFEPAAVAKGPVPGPRRRALWLGHGLLAVAGEDGSNPAGLHLIDARSWTVRTLHGGATGFAFTGSTLLAYRDFLFGPEGERGIGLVGYAVDGTRLFQAFGDRPFGTVATVGARAWVYDGAGAFKAVDAITGQVVGELPVRVPEQFPQLFVGDAQRW